MLLANKHLTPVLGLDIHIVTLPIGPIPLPHPFIGLVMDPMDYVPFIGSTVKINFVPRGIADTSGMMVTFVHIPMGGPFVMAPMIGHESVNFFGSLKVKAEDVALSPSGYMLMSCNDIGMPLSLSPGKKMKPVPSLFLPTSMTIPLPLGKPVMVGGPYAPDLLGILKQLAMSYGFGALMKVGGKIMKKALTALNHAIPKNKFTKGLKGNLCKMGFEPVDLVDGRMVYEGTDFELPGPLPLKWERRWYSDSAYRGPLGHGFHHNFDMSLTPVPEHDAVVMILPDGRPTAFPLLLAPGDSFYNRPEKLTLTCIDALHYKVKDNARGLIYTFQKRLDGIYRPIKMENTMGHSLGFQYNTDHRLNQITDSVGRKIHLHMDAEGRIVHIEAKHRGFTLPLVSYSYNEVGDLVAITDALEQSTTMQYQNHLMVAKTDRNGQTFYWEYDGTKSGARVIHTWGDGGILEGWIEYGKGMNTVTNSLGHKTLYHYNDDKLCTQVTDPLGNSIFHEYTDFMELYRDIDEEGNLTGFSYDERGNLIKITHTDGGEDTFVYNEEGQQVLAMDPVGNTTVKVYDKKGWLSATVWPDGSSSSIEYNEHALVSVVRDEKGSQTCFFYDEDHNLVNIKFPNSGETIWRFNEWGRCTETKDPEGRATNFNYDVLGRVTTAYLPDGNALQLSYDAYDSVVVAHDRQHHVNFKYTALGSLKAREEKGSKVQFNYDTEGQLLNVINEHGEAYRFARNSKGDIIQEVGFDGLTRKFQRDRAGKVIRVERPGNRYTEYEYDLANNLTRIEHSDGSWETFSYDKARRLIEAVNENSHLSIQRDNMGRVIKEIQDGHELTSSYDKLGQRIQISSSLGATIKLERNVRGLVEHLHASQSDIDWEARINYNAFGQELERVAGKVTSSYSYDYGGRINEHKISSEGRIRKHRQYSWNVNEQLYKITDLINKGSIAFDYDTYGNLVKAQYEDYTKVFKTPDILGNHYKRENHSDRKYGLGGQLLEADGNKYTYDLEGNLIKKVTEEGEWNYEWSMNGSLTSVQRPDHKVVAFEYDALGRRTAKIFNNQITRWIWDGNTPFHEWKYDLDDRPKSVLDESGMLAKDHEEPTENLVTWVFDEGKFRPAARIENDTSYSIINDYLGTPNEAYNDNGEKVWEIDLDIYGKARKGKGDKCFIPFRYQGQYEDSETGLYYNRFRYYSPEEGIYVSQDPIRLNGGHRLYSYVNDSNSLLDIFGLSPIIICDELAKIARAAHDTYPKGIGFNNTTISVAEVVHADGTKALYASGSGSSVSPAARAKLIELGVPEKNIFSGENHKWYEYTDYDTTKTKKYNIANFMDKELTNLANHAERVIQNNIPGGSTISKFGISWASNQRNEMCDNCKTHFGCH